MSDNEAGDMKQMHVESQIVASGAVLMETTQRSMRAMSLQAPRNLEKILREILDEVDRVSDWAERAFYAYPKGKGTISGPSVQLTRIVARNFGNCSVRSYLYGTSGAEGYETYQLCGVFFDLQKNYSIERMYTVSPQKWRDGGYVQLRGEELMQEIMIGASKAERNAVVSAVPDWIMQTVFERCRKIAADTTRKTMSAVVQWFLERGVAREALERAVGENLDQLNDDQLADLRGIKNALRDREISPAEIGRGPEDEVLPAEDAEATQTLDDVLSAGATTTGGTSAWTPENPSPEQAKPALTEDEQRIADLEASLAEAQARKAKGEEPAIETGGRVVPIRSGPLDEKGRPDAGF